jgi:hypothetical protein
MLEKEEGREGESASVKKVQEMRRPGKYVKFEVITLMT